MSKYVNKKEQARRKETTRLMVGLGLSAHLNNLMDAILKGDASKLSEFQQVVQYAPAKMREQLLDRLEARNQEKKPRLAQA